MEASPSSPRVPSKILVIVVVIAVLLIGFGVGYLAGTTSISRNVTISTDYRGGSGFYNIIILPDDVRTTQTGPWNYTIPCVQTMDVIAEFQAVSGSGTFFLSLTAPFVINSAGTDDIVVSSPGSGSLSLQIRCPPG